LAALASWLYWLHRFGLFLADQLGKKFGQQFFSGPRYIVNFQLPAVGRTSKKHTVELEVRENKGSVPVKTFG
jgi:hypothetical protein